MKKERILWIVLVAVLVLALSVTSSKNKDLKRITAKIELLFSSHAFDKYRINSREGSSLIEKSLIDEWNAVVDEGELVHNKGNKIVGKEYRHFEISTSCFQYSIKTKLEERKLNHELYKRFTKNLESLLSEFEKGKK